jgi:arylformamidase
MRFLIAFLSMAMLLVSAPASAGLRSALVLEDGSGLGADAVVATGITVQRDIPYGVHPAQRMDAYIPSHVRGAPVVFMVHGGGWRRGDKAMANVVENKVARWVPQGVVFVSINYRMLPEADPLTQAHDVARALERAQKMAASWGADPSRFVLMGHSAGAHLVALVASAPSFTAGKDIKPWLGAVVLDSGGLDIVQIMESDPPPLYKDAFGSDPAYWRAASPIHRLTGQPAPMLVVCSTRRPVPCRQAQQFVSQANSLGSRSSVLPLDMSHSEINNELGLPSRYTLQVEQFMRSLGLAL